MFEYFKNKLNIIGKYFMFMVDIPLKERGQEHKTEHFTSKKGNQKEKHIQINA